MGTIQKGSRVRLTPGACSIGCTPGQVYTVEEIVTLNGVIKVDGGHHLVSRFELVEDVQFQPGDIVKCTNVINLSCSLIVGECYRVLTVDETFVVMESLSTRWTRSQFERTGIVSGSRVRANGHRQDLTVSDVLVQANGAVVLSLNNGSVWFPASQFVLAESAPPATKRSAQPPKDDYGDRLMAFFATSCMPNTCAKCACPTPCKWHP